MQSEELKKNSEQGTNIIVSGYISYFNNMDLQNDTILPFTFNESIEKFYEKKNKIHFLLQHNAQQPIGEILNLTTTKEGIFFTGKIISDISYNKDLILLLKKKIIYGLSVGLIIKEKYYENKNRIITKADLVEVSLVTIPANKMCTIHDCYEENKKI